MTMFTGFYEAHGMCNAEFEDEVRLVTRQDLDTLLDRLRERLGDAPPGTHIRIDLLVWKDGEAPAL